MAADPNAEPSLRERTQDMLVRAEPGRLYPWVKLASYVELALFAGLLFFWLAPGFEHETFIFGMGHGIGYLALLALIWIAFLRHEVPLWLLAATATPLGPVGSVVGIELWDRSRARRAAEIPVPAPREEAK